MLVFQFVGLESDFEEYQHVIPHKDDGDKRDLRAWTCMFVVDKRRTNLGEHRRA